jgi:hypothetical protein
MHWGKWVVATSCYSTNPLDHCIDQLRQNIQCHGDATMNGATWYEGGQKAFVDTENIYTCRDFNEFGEWEREKTNVAEV